ncbi:MAG: hypothetical protein EXR72_04895 [Myxococcales bacterium]|nr:hypothetical protein [Myxococcales bacterium]
MRLWLLVPSLAALGCVEPPFSLHARDNSVEDIQRTLATYGASEKGPRGGGHAMAYLVTAAPKHLVAYDLTDGKIAWDVEANVTSRLAVGRGFVAHRQGPTEVAIRNGADGALRCTARIKAEEKFLGLTAEDRLYYVVQSSSGTTRTSYAVAISPDGCGEVWRDEASGSLGAPAARGGMVAVPYAYQNLVLLDGKSGAEVARVRATDESITFVRAEADGFYYGANSGIYLLDVKSATGSKKGSSFTAAKMASQQIRSFYFYDSYQHAQADYTAFDRNRLLWRAEPKGESVAFRDGAAFLHSYRFFFAFDADSGAIRWAYAHPRVDVVGSDDSGASIVYATADGQLCAIDARSGGLAWSKKTGLKVTGVTFDADGFAPGTGGQPPSVAQTLATIIWDPDARFTAVKVFAVDAMTKVPGREVTEVLVKVVLKEGMAPAVVARAAEALVTRQDADSAPLYREALALHYDYLADRRVRGVDTLARVSAVVSDRESSALLARHLADPATPLAAMKEIVKSIVSLGGPEAVKPLRDLVLAYRCDPSFNSDPQALQLAVDGLLRLGGPEERRLLVFVAEEKRTLPSLGAFLRKILVESAPRLVPKVAPKAKPGEDQPDTLGK